jgi:hypothetical protein
MKIFHTLPLTTGLIVALVSCGGGNSETQSSPFWDAAEPPPGISARFLDPMPPLEKMYDESDAVVVAEVIEVVDTKNVDLNVDLSNATIEPEIEESVRERLEYMSQAPDFTTFAVEIREWIKGEDDAGEVLVRQFGGVMPDGYYRIMDGDALLEAGRSYVLFLRKDGDGLYERLWFGRGVYDITSGETKVMNHWLLEDLNHLEGMTTEEISEYLTNL